MTHCFIEPRTKKYVKGYGFISFVRNLSSKYGKNIVGYCYKNWTRRCKNCFQKNSP